MRLRFTRTALREIESVLSYLAARSTRGERSLRECILSAAALVREHPYAAQATNRPNTRRFVLNP